jgi:hypothetical protein
MERALEAVGAICNEKGIESGRLGEAYPDTFHRFSRTNVSFVRTL